MEVHSPYYLPGKYLGEYSDVENHYQALKACERAQSQYEPANLINHYYEGIHYLDQQFRTFMEEIMQTFVDPYIIITNDHGEVLGEQVGEYGHSHEEVYPEQIEAPLLIDTFRVDAIRHNESALLTHLDILPTILDLYGIETPPRVRGCSLFDSIDQDRVIAETCPYDQDEYKLMYEQSKTCVVGRHETYVDEQGLEPQPYDLDIEEIINEHRVKIHYNSTVSDIIRLQKHQRTSEVK